MRKKKSTPSKPNSKLTWMRWFVKIPLMSWVPHHPFLKVNLVLLSNIPSMKIRSTPRSMKMRLLEKKKIPKWRRQFPLNKRTKVS